MLLIAAVEALENEDPENEDPVLPNKKQQSDSRGGNILASVMKWIVPSVGEMVEVKRKH